MKGDGSNTLIKFSATTELLVECFSVHELKKQITHMRRGKALPIEAFNMTMDYNSDRYASCKYST